MDRRFWQDYGARLPPAEYWTCNAEAARIWGLNHIRMEPHIYAERSTQFISSGGNSGYQAVELARVFGAARVILLGYDMQSMDGRLHWHPDYSHNNPLPNSFKEWIGHFNLLAADYPGLIINCTRISALRCFPRELLQQALLTDETRLSAVTA